MTNEYDFLKKQRYEYYKGTTGIIDNEANEIVEDVVDVLNQKDYNIIELLKIKQFKAQRIAELEEQLKNCIRPKFKIGQEVWCVYKYWYNGVLSEIRNKLFDVIFVEITEIHIEKDYISYIFQPKPRQNRFGYDDFEYKDNLLYQMRNFGDTRYIDNYWLFTTKEEAQAKLRELGEKK